MTNFTAFNYSKFLDTRDKSKLYESQDFDKSSTDQEYISLSELVENGVHGVLSVNSGRRKVMSYNNFVEPVGGFDLSDVNLNEYQEAKDHFINNKEKENVVDNKSVVSNNSILDTVEPGKEEVSSRVSES